MMIKTKTIIIAVFIMMLALSLIACGGTPPDKSSYEKHPSEPIEVEDISDIGYPDITVYGAPDRWYGKNRYYYVIDNKEGVVYLQHLNVSGQASTESMSIMLKRNGEPLTIDDLRGY